MGIIKFGSSNSLLGWIIILMRALREKAWHWRQCQLVIHDYIFVVNIPCCSERTQIIYHLDGPNQLVFAPHLFVLVSNSNN